MSAYLARRLLSMIPVLLIASMISFCLLYVLPGDPAVAILGENAVKGPTYQALRHDLGLDQPLWIQYAKWLTRVVHGDLGKSTRTGEPVATGAEFVRSTHTLDCAGSRLVLPRA